MISYIEKKIEIINTKEFWCVEELLRLLLNTFILFFLNYAVEATKMNLYLFVKCKPTKTRQEINLLFTCECDNNDLTSSM